MRIYFDIDHFKSLAKLASHPLFKDCVAMLQRNLDIYFLFKKIDLLKPDKKQVLDAVKMLITEMQRNRGSQKVVEIDSLPVFGQEKCSFEDLTAIYMSHIPNGIESGVLHAEVGEEVNTLAQLFVDNRYIPTKQYSIPKMRDWSLIDKEATSCSDIIIADRYLFAQTDIHYQVNAYDLIRSLCAKIKNSRINITIFTLPQYPYTDPNGRTQMASIDFDAIIRSLTQQVEEITCVKPKITIVKLPVREEHDRTIFTNYKLFNSGDSFKYFEESANGVTLISKGRFLYVNSHIDRENLNNSKSFIEAMQDIINDRKNGLASIKGDKESNFLYFS